MINDYDGLQFDQVKQLVSQYCSFSLGSKLVLNSQPSFNKMVVSSNEKKLKEALAMVVGYGPMPFSGIYDCQSAIDLASKNSTLNPQELYYIASLYYGVENVKNYVKQADVSKEAILDLISSFNDTKDSAIEILRCINANYQLNDNASSQLASLRKKIKQLNSSIASKMNSYIQTHSQYLQESIIVSRNGRNVVLVKDQYKNSVGGLIYGQTASKAAVYVEPSEMVQINNDLAQAVLDEENEVKRILFSLSQLVKKDSSAYMANLNTLAILDCLFAKAMWAKKVNGTVGSTADDYDLVIENARHPLIDSSKVVSNSYHLVDPYRTILITGPNTGGKTVSLKVIGLFTVLHLAGFGLPCDSASIPVYDNVFYDIGDSQSISEDLSTFSGHIKELADIIYHATNHSLVILDELGSGTDPLEGEALASAIINYFRKKHIFTIASTHYSKLKSYASNYNDVMVSSVQFDQINLKPTYKYIENSIGSSNGLNIALRYGINKEIVDEAILFKQQNQTKEDSLLEKLDEQIKLVNQKKEELNVLENALILEKEELNKQKKEWEEKKNDIINTANISANQIVLDAKDQSEEIIEKLKKLESYRIDEVASLKHQLDSLEYENEVNDEQQFNVGDYVCVTLTGQTGEIVDIKNQRATIDCSGIKVSSSISNLTLAIKPTNSNRTVSKVYTDRRYRSEINLIGLRVEEALRELDPFINTAIMVKAPYVRIVHGYGTGALRSAVWQHLKKYNAIEKVEYAASNDGGAGATIVTFKKKVSKKC